MDPLLRLSAGDLATRIRDRDVSPGEVLETHIRRLRQVNPALNAVAEEHFEQAREEAAVQTKILMDKDPAELPPFFGVPFTCKEMLAVRGMKSTAGAVHWREHRADKDASVYHRLRQAGANLLATTNVPELGFWFECENPVYGRTNNPYDPRRTCGGSSGGEGALIGAGASPMGLGSDIGGSIRMPAAFCGVFGHKPSNHLLPLTGHFPFSNEDFRNLRGERYPLTTTGFLSRSARDLAPLLRILKGPDGIDLETRDVNLRQAPRDPSRWRVLVCEDPIFHLSGRAEAPVRASVQKAARLFEQYGARMETFDERFFLRGVELWIDAVKATKDRSFQDLLNPNGPLHVGREIARSLFGRGQYSWPSLLTLLLEKWMVSSDERVGRSLRELARMKREFHRILGDDGLLLCPVHPRTAPRHRATLQGPFDFIGTGIFNALEVPATSIPMGFDDHQLPLAVQAVAAPFQDDLTIAAAEVLESAFGGWSPPSSL
ncbi:MAG: amidase [Bdellovibrionaceae bacterium]|nr:amidase [Pseudobdellovibrionaceae bacterium]